MNTIGDLSINGNLHSMNVRWYVARDAPCTLDSFHFWVCDLSFASCARYPLVYRLSLFLDHKITVYTPRLTSHFSPPCLDPQCHLHKFKSSMPLTFPPKAPENILFRERSSNSTRALKEPYIRKEKKKKTQE